MCLEAAAERDLEGLGELPDRPFAAGKLLKHPATGRVAEGVKHGVEMSRLKFNHVVEYEVAAENCKPFG